MSNIFDAAIIGTGVAGAFACLKIAKDHKDLKVIAFEASRPPRKRRPQMQGWLGLFPNSDGKLFLSDVPKIANITGLRKAKSSFTWFKHIIKQVDDFKVIKDHLPAAAMEKRISKFGYDM